LKRRSTKHKVSGYGRFAPKYRPQKEYLQHYSVMQFGHLIASEQQKH
jgi:hypothetical protein